jgi:hypothetical protein
MNKILVTIGLLLITCTASADESGLFEYLDKVQKKTEKIEVRLNTRENYAQGAFSNSLPEVLINKEKSANAVYPATETTIDGSIELFLSSDNIRFNQDSQIWSLKEKKFLPYSFSTNTSASLTTSLLYTNPEHKIKTGVIDAQTTQRFHDFHNTPLLFIMRSNSPGIWPGKKSNTKLNNKNYVRGNTKLYEYEITMNAREKYLVYTDPLKSHCVSLMELFVDNKLTKNYEIENSLNSQINMYLPDSWRIVNSNKTGQLLSTSILTLTELKIDSEDIDSKIAIQFDKGIKIEDNRNRKVYISDGNFSHMNLEKASNWRATVSIFLIVAIVALLSAILTFKHKVKLNN